MGSVIGVLIDMIHRKYLMTVILCFILSSFLFNTHAYFSGLDFGVKVDLLENSPPEISNITSFPLIIDIGENVNITCNVTDVDDDLDTVWLNVTYPDSSTTNNSMDQYGATSCYYRNTTYNQEGNHTFFIWANDTNGNTTLAYSINCSVFDDFGAQSYSNQNGTDEWYDDWYEYGGDNDPATGDIQIVSDTNMTPTENYNLMLKDYSSGLAIGRQAIWGNVFPTNGTLEFDWRCDSTEATYPSEGLGVYILNPDVGWSRIAWLVDNTDPTTYHHFEDDDLSYCMNEYFSIMFQPNASVDSDDYFYIDNIYINYTSDEQKFQVLSGGEPNQPPEISTLIVNPLPGEEDLDVNYPYPDDTLKVWIEDPDGDSFNWTIECSTGNNNSGQEADGGGVVTCSIADSLPLDYSTKYYWWINITVYTGDTPPVNRTFNFTTENENNPPIINISSASPSNGSTSESISLSDLEIWVGDNETTFNWTIECSNGNSSSDNGANNGTKECPVDGGDPLSYDTEYFWWVNVTDGEDWTNATLNFTTGSEPVNHPPVISSPSPSDHATDVSSSISAVSVTITDADGDTFNWSIETSLGDSNSGNDASNGSKSCTLASLSYDDDVTWWVNVSDEATNKTYEFSVASAPPGPYEQLSENTGWLIMIMGVSFIFALLFSVFKYR